MGVCSVRRLLCFVWLSLFFLVIRSPCPIAALNANGDGGRYYIGHEASSSNPPPPPLPPPPPPLRPVFEQRSSFRPSIAVIVGILTTMFSITFLLLLYAKHCKGGNGYPNSSVTRMMNTGGVGPSASATRKDSGIDRKVIESLPVFRFGSLRGQKDGLECAVCLNRFEPTEVLRLLPKCKHAFHVECVDTWLDAHSTCPLCRYRVDPEDILLLVEDSTSRFSINERDHPHPPPPPVEMGIRRVSGRHSSAGESASEFLQLVVDKPQVEELESSSSSAIRRSLDSSSILLSLKNKNNSSNQAEAVSVGCFDRPRKDGLLLTEGTVASDRTRFEHRIVVSTGVSGIGFHHPHRWSDVQPSDLLYLRSEMIISDSRRFSVTRSSVSSRSSSSRQHYNPNRNGGGGGGIDDDDRNNGWWQRQRLPWQTGRSVINTRSVSEITGLSRFPNRSSNEHHRQHQQRQRQAGTVSRWLDWISLSQSQSQPAVLRSGRSPIQV